MTQFVRIIVIKVDIFFARRQAHEMLLATTLNARQQRDVKARRWVAAILVFVAVVMLMEVVLAPGSMIRNHLRPLAATDTSAGTSEQMQRLQRFYSSVDARWGAFQHDVEQQLGVNPALADPKSLPPKLQAITRDNPTAWQAWTDLQQTTSDISKRIAQARAVIQHADASAISSPSLENDDKQVFDAIDDLERCQRLLHQLQIKVDHLSFLLRQ